MGERVDKRRLSIGGVYERIIEKDSRRRIIRTRFFFSPILSPQSRGSLSRVFVSRGDDWRLTRRMRATWAKWFMMWKGRRDSLWGNRGDKGKPYRIERSRAWRKWLQNRKQDASCARVMPTRVLLARVSVLDISYDQNSIRIRRTSNDWYDRYFLCRKKNRSSTCTH